MGGSGHQHCLDRTSNAICFERGVEITTANSGVNPTSSDRAGKGSMIANKRVRRELRVFDQYFRHRLVNAASTFRPHPARNYSGDRPHG